MDSIKSTVLPFLTKSNIANALGNEGQQVEIIWERTPFLIKWEQAILFPYFIINIGRKGTKIPGYIIQVNKQSLIIPEVAKHLMLWSTAGGELYHD